MHVYIPWALVMTGRRELVVVFWIVIPLSTHNTLLITVIKCVEGLFEAVFTAFLFNVV
jgi:hypothetical protein